MFIDTNVTSHFKRGLLVGSIKGGRISSVSASELLLVYGEKRTAANYYVPLVSRRHVIGESPRRDHAFSKRVTDQIVFSFGNDFEPLVEFGSLAISRLINENDSELLRRSIAFLDKPRQKIIREDFGVIVGNELQCIPLEPPTIEIAYRLLDSFSASGERLKTTFRNTWNDLLILATAWAHNDELISRDNQLNRFAASSFGECHEVGGGFLKIRFPRLPETRARKVTAESKGYINRGWRASFRAGMKKAL